MLGQPEAITSSFSNTEIGTWILRLLAQVAELPESEIPLLLSHTYGGFLMSLHNPNWHAALKTGIDKWISRMLEVEIIERRDKTMRLTLLGHECGRSALSLESCIRLIQLFRHYSDDLREPLKFMALLQLLPEIDAQYTPIFKKGQREMVWLQQLGRTYPDVIKAIQQYADDIWQYVARAKRACILKDWINGVSIEQMESAYTINSFSSSVGLGDIRRIADLTRFHLKPAYQIAMLTMPDNVPNADEMEVLLRQLEVGIPAAGVDLLSLPFSLARGEYLSLISAGICTSQAFVDLPLTELERVIGAARAHQLDMVRKSLSEL